MIINKISPKFEVNKIKGLIPEILSEMSEDFDFIVAGGMITSIFTNSEVNDVDVYLKSEDDIFPIVTSLHKSCSLVSATDKSVLFATSEEVLINIILFRTYETVEDIFDSFDFSCVMGAFSLRDDAFYLHEDFLTHNAQRILRFNSKTEFPIMSLIRVDKYEKKGYTISKNEMLRMILSSTKLNISSYAELEAHIGGMYGLNLAKIIDTEKEFDLPAIIEEFKEIFTVLDNIPHDWDVNIERLQAKMLTMYFKGFKQLSYFKWKSNYCLVGNGVLLGEVTEEIFKSIDRKIGLHIGMVKVYKYVTKEETKFVSCREKSFEYKLGEVVIPANIVGIFCGTFSRRKQFTYYTNLNNSLIELLVNVEDFIKINGSDDMFDIGCNEITVKKALFKRVVDENKNETSKKKNYRTSKNYKVKRKAKHSW